ncbi:MAG: alpha-E domain-containing protein [Hasllibacter sp.]
MLSRTAENLFWLARYIERAETVARLTSVGARAALTPDAIGGHRNEWQAVLKATGQAETFAERFGTPNQRDVLTHLVLDEDNPGSVAACVARARENGRIVRTALTGQTWDALSEALAEMRDMRRTERSRMSAEDMVDRVTRMAALVRGAVAGTQLRDDGWDFLRLGYLIERMDGTARAMDVKYFVLLPSAAMVGSGVDNYQWATVLRALNAQGSFTWAYGGGPDAARIVEFLVLNPDCPRGVLPCASDALWHLEHLGRRYGTTGTACKRARALVGDLAETGVADIFEEGLHEFLQRMQREASALSGAVAADYWGPA